MGDRLSSRPPSLPAVLSFLLLLPLSTLLLGAPPAHGAVERDAILGVEGSIPTPTSAGTARVHSTTTGREGAWARTAVDSFLLFGGPGTSEGKFEDGLVPDLQGWTTVDRTEPLPEGYWQISTFNAATLNDNGAGNRAAWCGRSAEQAPGWASAPGYGNHWVAVLEYESAPLADPGVGQTVDLDFWFHQDTEPGYDFFSVEFDSAGVWVPVYSASGTTRPDPGVDDFPAPGTRFSDVGRPIVFAPNGYSLDGTIRIRMVVRSDYVYSDEDGLWDTLGAVQLDDVLLVTSQGSWTEDFEGPGPHLFEERPASFAGDFARVWARLDDIDPCRSNGTPVVAFVDDGTPPHNAPNPDGVSSTGGSYSPQWDYGFPTAPVVNHTGGLSFGDVALRNEIWSPEIAWDLPVPDDDGADVIGAELRYDVWEHLPLINGVFHVWSVRSQRPDASWSEWRNENFVYYGADPVWTSRRFDVTEYLVVDPQAVQIALGVWDMAELFALPGTDATPAPVYDNVSLVKYRVAGPVIAARTRDLPQDGFPPSGSIDASTPSARDALDVPFDLGLDIGNGYPSIDSGDSVVFDVASRIPGAEVDAVHLRWALRRNPLFDDVRAAPARPQDDMVDTSGEIWTGRVLALPVTTAAGVVVEGRWFVDLPDEDFLHPGDQLHVHVEVHDTDGRRTTLPADLDGFGQWTADGVSVYDRRWVVRGLPSLGLGPEGGQPTILVLDETGDFDVEAEWIQSFTAAGYRMGIEYDVYAPRDPGLSWTQGIGAAGGRGATAAQLSGYDTIFYLAGDRSGVHPSDGTYTSGDDLEVLGDWYDEAGLRQMVFFGSEVVEGLASSGLDGDLWIRDVLGLEYLGPSVLDHVNGQSSPRVRPAKTVISSWWFDVPFVAYGGCLQPADFDALRPRSEAIAGHEFLDPSGLPVGSVAASVVHERYVLGERKLAVTFPFSFASVWQDPVTPIPSTRTAFLVDLLEFLRYGRGNPAPPATRHALALEVAPSPFNPRTTVTFTQPAAGRASVKVYDLRGALVRTLVDRELDAGVHPLTWDGRDATGRAVASGIYLVHATSAGRELTRKAVVLK